MWAWLLNNLGMGGGGAVATFAGDDIQSAIAAWWAGQSSLHPLVSDGRIWHVQASEGVPLPYLTYFVVSESERPGRTTGYYHLDALVQISAHAETDVAAAAIRDAVRDAIEDARLVVEGSPVMWCLPGDQRLMIGDGKGPDGTDCWIGAVEVSAPWQKGAA
jgi:hypothetical protein